MKRPSGATRRRFLGATAAGGLLLPVTRRLLAAEAIVPPAIPSTDHFRYRVPTEGPYIDSQRGNKAFGFTDDAVCLSENNSRTWPHSLPFPNARNITFSHIFKNGNVLFATRTRLYLSTDMGKTWAEYDLKEFGPRSPVRFHQKNGEGWFRVDLRERWINRADVMFIKPKEG